MVEVAVTAAADVVDVVNALDVATPGTVVDVTEPTDVVVGVADGGTMNGSERTITPRAVAWFESIDGSTMPTGGLTEAVFTTSLTAPAARTASTR